jgi:signal transduction histidine kinase
MEAEQRHVSLETNDSGPCLIAGGEEAASDIVSNLLVNALEASREGSAIRIRLTHRQVPSESIELSIDDQGRGIPKDKLDKIFQPFFTTRPGGTGLGLAIVKRRADEIGGSVECQSPAEAESSTSAHLGTRFVVRFLVANSPTSAGLGVRD